MFDWIIKHVELIITAIFSLAGGAITGATFILRMKGDVERIQLTTIRIENEVIELKKFKDEFLVAKTKLEEYEGDVEELKSDIKNGRTELALEFTKTINNVIDMMKEYIKRNDSEVERLRERYHDISNNILVALLDIQRSMKK